MMTNVLPVQRDLSGAQSQVESAPPSLIADLVPSPSAPDRVVAPVRVAAANPSTVAPAKPVKASGISTAAPARQTVVPASDRPALEGLLKNALEKHVKEELGRPASSQLQDFRVNWSTLRCLTVKKGDIGPTAPIGVCAVDAGAFQIFAAMAILKTSAGYKVDTLYSFVD